MHRATPLMTSFRSFTAGGARSIVDAVKDNPLMQEMAGNFMKGETRDKIESPQNYGFTSVVADALKGKDGQIMQSAEAFISFIGGNRSFPVAGIMDDRRHRLKNLIDDAAKGSTAMFGLKEWGQQFLNTDTGMFMTGNVAKKLMLQLVENQNGKQQTQQPGQRLERAFRSRSGVEFEIETFELTEADIRDAAANGGTPQGQSQATGQKTLHKEKSDTFVQLDKDAITITRGNGKVVVTDSAVMTQYKDEKISTRVDSSHAHIRCGENRIFVDQSGCWSTKAIEIKADPTATAVPMPSRQELLARIEQLEAAVAALQAAR